MFLMDTDVVSALRRPDRHPNPTAWLLGQKVSDVYLSVMTIGEIERGIATQEHLNPPFALDLATWLDSILVLFDGRILNVNLPIAKRWRRLVQNLGHNTADLLIAATAIEHGFTVVTRNVRHFEPTGVIVLNPFEPAEE